jgi:hypothetical protein
MDPRDTTWQAVPSAGPGAGCLLSGAWTFLSAATSAGAGALEIPARASVCTVLRTGMSARR